MKITRIKIKKNTKAKPEGAKADLLGYVSITFDDFLAVHEIKLIKKEDGTIFVAMPSKKIFTTEQGDETPQYKFSDIVHPVSTEAREYIEKTILDFYNTQPKES